MLHRVPFFVQTTLRRAYTSTSLSKGSAPSSVWDIDITDIFSANNELASDHPGFQDAEYRQRRKVIAELAANYKGGPIPSVPYSLEEDEVWKKCFERVGALLPTHACQAHIETLQEMQENNVLSKDKDRKSVV